MSLLNSSNWWTLGNQPEPYVTKSVEPIYDGPKHIATKSKYRYLGEYLPLGKGGGLNTNINQSDSQKFNILNFFNSFSTLFSSNDQEQCVLSEISVDQNKGFGIIPYDVSCDCYKFLSGEGIISASNTLDFNENEDRTININHNISVKYLNINANNYSNAKTFAQGLTGNINSWKFADYNNFGSPIVLSSREASNLSNGTYEISNQYLVSKTNNGITTPVIRTSATIESGFENSRINLRGNVFTGNQSFNIASLATYIESYSAPGEFKLIGGNANNNDFDKTFDFNLIYSDDKRITTNANLLNQSISVNIDFITTSKQISYQSSAENITAIDHGTLSSDLITNSTAAKNAVALFQIGSAFSIENFTGFSTGVLNYSERLENSLRITGDNGKLKYYDLSININVTPALYQASYAPLLSGKGSYYIEDLDYKNRGRANLSIDGKATVDSINTINALELSKFLNTHRTEFLKDGVMLNDELSIDYKSLSFKYTQELSYEDDSFKEFRAA